MSIMFKVLGLFFVAGVMGIGMERLIHRYHKRQLERMNFTETHKLRLRRMR